MISLLFVFGSTYLLDARSQNLNEPIPSHSSHQLFLSGSVFDQHIVTLPSFVERLAVGGDDNAGSDGPDPIEEIPF